MATWIRIGDFARLAHVTVRTLRHYEHEGLLRPRHVRNRSGYRYYDVTQLLVVQRILVLRDLGLSIPDVRAVLRCIDGGAEILNSHRAQLRKAILDNSARLDQLDSILRGLEDSADRGAASMRVRSIPPTTAFCRRATVSNLGTAVTELFERAEAAASGARIDESPFLLFHGDRRANGNLDIEVCIPVDPCAQMPGIRTIDGFAAAGCVIYQGAYSQTDSLFDSMRRWIKQTGATATGPRREVYHRFGADQIGYGLPGHRLACDPADFVTELQIPMVRSSQCRGDGR